MQRQALTTFTNRSVYAASLQATATSPRHTQFIAQHDVITRHGISLWSVWASLLPTPETEAALTLCTYSAIAKTLMRYQHYFGHQSKTQHHIRAAMKEINSIPSSPSRSGWHIFHQKHTRSCRRLYCIKELLSAAWRNVSLWVATYSQFI